MHGSRILLGGLSKGACMHGYIYVCLDPRFQISKDDFSCGSRKILADARYFLRTSPGSARNEHENVSKCCTV